MSFHSKLLHSAHLFTVFTDVQLFEVNQTGDGGGQVGQVVIWHAQLLQGLAVEELLWRHMGKKGGNKRLLSSVCKITQTFSRTAQKDRDRESQLEANVTKCCGKAVQLKLLFSINTS